MSDIRGEFEDNNDDDDFSFDNEFDFGDEGDTGAPSGDFDFGEEEGEFEFGEEPFGPEEEIPELGEVEEEREGGISRPFLIIAALMILLFVGGLVAVLLLAGPRGPTDFEMTATSIVMTNEAVAVALNMTGTQSVLDAQATQTADAFTDTPTPSPSPTRPPTITPTPPLDATQIAATSVQLTALAGTSVALTATAASPTPQEVSLEGVQLTATALAQLLLGAGGGPTPTGEVLTTPGTPRPTALPDTGLFDDLTAGSTTSMSLLALMALGLVGVIVVSRRMRAANNR
jgi:hypothetical protein